MKKTMLSVIFLASFAALASSEVEKDYSSEEKPYVQKYRKILSDFSTIFSGNRNDEAIVFEAATTSDNSGRVIFKNVVFFGEMWDFSEHFFNKDKITSSSLVKMFDNERLTKISFENVSNKIYKKFGVLPKGDGEDCLSDVKTGGNRCYRVFNLPVDNNFLELSIYNKRMVLSLGGEYEKKQ